MNPFEIRDQILQLLSDKIDSGEERNITKEEVNNLLPLFEGGEHGLVRPSFLKDLYEKLSSQTVKEIETLRHQW